MASRLEQHINHEHLYEPFQSAYWKGHSTEAAFLKFMDDLLRPMERKNCIVVALLDLSAAFDTVGHTKAPTRTPWSHYPSSATVCTPIGLSGSAPAWLTSYLQGRRQTVHVIYLTDLPPHAVHELEFRVFQDSVLGLLLFCIYALLLGNIIRNYGIKYDFCGDDI